jgi:hypothetical protein
MGSSYVLYKETEDSWPKVAWVAEGMEAELREQFETEGFIVLPVVVLSVEEHKRLLAAVDALDILRKVSWDLARRK